MRDRRQQREGCGRRIATWHSDRSRAGQLVPLSRKLGQSVRPSAGMRRLVEPLPGLSLLQSKIGSTVDHHSVGMQLRSHLAGGSVWKGEEDHIVISKHVRRCLFHHAVQQRNQLWMVLAEQRSRIGTCGQAPISTPGCASSSRSSSPPA